MSDIDAETILLRASFKPQLKTYFLWQWIFAFLITLVGIPLLVLIPVVILIISRQYLALSCEMTEKFLKVRKGILVKIEKNVPLEQITDMGIVEGPFMRMLGIKQLSVETAGQSSQGPLVKLLAIDGPEDFRDKVLKQRDLLRKTVQTDTAIPAASGDTDVQREILATLRRIEGLLSKQ